MFIIKDTSTKARNAWTSEKIESREQAEFRAQMMNRINTGKGYFEVIEL